MLKNIKSRKILKDILEPINFQKLLNIVKYNKSLQNKLVIDISYYKIFSKRHIIFEQEGKGKEYNNKDNLIFEGEFKNGKRNGKGKEYNTKNELIFQGEYKNGKRWNGTGYNNNIAKYKLNDGKGFIKIYNNNNKIQFEGEYVNGKRNGKGKEYDI